MLGATAAENTFSNRGTLRVEASQFAQNARIPQLVGGAMSEGRIEVGTGADWFGFPHVTALNGTVALEGTGRVRENFFEFGSSLRDLTTIGADGGLELRDGASLAVGGAGIINNGRILMTGPAALTLNNFTQTPTGALAVEVGAESGSIMASEADARRNPRAVSGSRPDRGHRRPTVVTASSLDGAFDTVTATDFGPVSVTYSGGASSSTTTQAASTSRLRSRSPSPT